MSYDNIIGAVGCFNVTPSHLNEIMLFLKGNRVQSVCHSTISYDVSCVLFCQQQQKYTILQIKFI